MAEFYTTYSEYLGRLFPGMKVQKITVDAGFTCPNRDGTSGLGGCIYCNNSTFSPSTGSDGKSLVEKIENGKRFFSHKYPAMKYLVYFQSYTNTYGDPDKLLDLFSAAMKVGGVEGIVIGTRPDCMPDSLLERLAMLNRSKPVIVEFGAETFCDSTLRLVNRNHTSAQTEDAVRRAAGAGLEVGLHLIMGLPGEDEKIMLDNVRRAAALPIGSVKFHQLQVIAGTELHRRCQSGERPAPTLFPIDEYLSLCMRIIRMVPRSIAIDRFVSQAPQAMLVAPKWGVRNHEFAARLEALLRGER